jgi:hypothetical protein
MKANVQFHALIRVLAFVRAFLIRFAQRGLVSGKHFQMHAWPNRAGLTLFMTANAAAARLLSHPSHQDRARFLMMKRWFAPQSPRQFARVMGEYYGRFAMLVLRRGLDLV